MKTTREKSEEKRQAKLEEIREQVDSGTLVIRSMTPDERRRIRLVRSSADGLIEH